MSLFKKKEKVKAVTGEEARIKILGSGCANCKALEKSTQEALLELGKDMQVDHITDFAKIAAYGVMTTPALVIDDNVVSYGRVLKKEEIKELLNKVL
ncbi:MAG: thioredoxin family protein [Eubacteriaceae bacterium]|nr:thioredoxin family protein [Eubacteriaceae bacterium]